MAFNASAVNVSAEGVNGRKTGRGKWAERDYKYINQALNYMGYDEEDKVYYTELQGTVKEEDRVTYVSFIYDDERAIGQYIKEETKEDVNSCFIINRGSELLNELVKYQEGSKFNIDQEEITMEASAIEGAKNKGWQTISKGSAEYITGFAETGKFLSPGIVSNKTRYANGTDYGLCWAACGASIVNYYLRTSYDTWGVYNKLVKETGLPELIGSAATIRCMFGTLGLRFDELGRRLTYTQALVALDDNSLIMYGIEGDYSKHGVVLCGTFRINSSYGFVYMDPNVIGGYVLNYNDQSVATSTSGNFYYYNGQERYTNVYVTYYNFEKLYYVK